MVAVYVIEDLEASPWERAMLAPDRILARTTCTTATTPATTTTTTTTPAPTTSTITTTALPGQQGRLKIAVKQGGEKNKRY